MEQIRVSSWNELQQRLYEESWKEPLGRFRSDLAFRGMSDARDPLHTTLYRLGGDTRSVEGHLLRNFRKYATREAVVLDTIWNWMSVGQHHGLPTRLLDWTYSPFVAMHFATYHLELFDRDGVIWCVDYVRAHKLVPKHMRKLLDAEGANLFTVEMLRCAAETLPEYEALANEEFAIFFEPPSLEQRIVNQFALFSMISSPSGQFVDWAERHPDLVKMIVIPAALKWEIRDKLDQANITERVLTPGLDGLSRWLKRHYTPRQR